MKRAAIGLGANLGDPVATLHAALHGLARIGTIAARSSLYETPPWGVEDQPPFVNAAVLLDTERAPYDLLADLKALERELGRVATFRWGPRAIDLDILAYQDVTLDDANLVIPHARLHERAFALVPLAEIDPAYGAARDALPSADVASVKRIGAFESEGVP